MLRLVPALLGAAGCGAPAIHPGRSPGIDRHPGVRDLYDLAEATRARIGLPAVGLGIVHRGRVLGLGMAGERTAGSGLWATLDDLFEVASCSKSVTATVAAILVERGTVRWQTTLADAFPELRTSMRPAFAPVTLEQLLRHRSGLGHELNRNVRWSGWHRRHAHLTAAEQRFAFAADALRRPPRSAPGTGTFYTSDGYVVAGSLLERAAGVEWNLLVRTLLFEPLGLRSIGHDVDARRGFTAATGHEPGVFGWPRAIPHDPDEYGPRPFGAPAGFMYATVPDLLRYVDFHIQGEHGRAPLLQPASFRRLHRALDGDTAALGWMSEVRLDADGRVVEHSVFHGGYSGVARANMWFVPETQWGTAIVVNDGRGDEAIASEIFYDLLREFGVVPRAPEALPG